jgi:hypothetical protein
MSPFLAVLIFALILTLAILAVLFMRLNHAEEEQRRYERLRTDSQERIDRLVEHIARQGGQDMLMPPPKYEAKLEPSPGFFDKKKPAPFISFNDKGDITQ